MKDMLRQASEAKVTVANQIAQSFEDIYEHAVAIDSNKRISWISEGYMQFLGIPHDPIGEPITRYVPYSFLPRVLSTGQPVYLDLMHIKEQWVLVSGIPLKDADGNITGAFGFIAVDENTRFGTLAKRFNNLQKQLDNVTSQLNQVRQHKYRLSQVAGRSLALQEVKSHIRQAARFDISVLLTGETGTGKELFAHALHELSTRAENSFVSLNVAAIPNSLIEAEFFGVAPGAYTGASKEGRIGKLELAHGGTLFLDEIGDMPFELQGKLLRALQEKEFEPVGSNTIKKVDTRIVAATSRNLAQMMEEGEFRADLYYRLSGMPIHLPALRERVEDIDLIAEHILDELCEKLDLPARFLSHGAIALLMQYHWPGNIRELHNILERALILSEDSSEITANLISKLLSNIQMATGTTAGHQDSGQMTGGAISHRAPSHSMTHNRLPPYTQSRTGRPPSMKEQVANAEIQAIKNALAYTQGHRAQAAKVLGISRASFYKKLQSYREFLQ